MFMKHKPAPMVLGGFAAGLLCLPGAFAALAGAGCSSGQRANERESVSNTQAADLVPPPGVLAGNSNYWITAANPDAGTGLPITGLTISIAVTQDLHIPNGVSVQLERMVGTDLQYRLAAVRIFGHTANVGMGNRKLADGGVRRPARPALRRLPQLLGFPRAQNFLSRPCRTAVLVGSCRRDIR